MNEHICLVKVPELGTCIRIPITREYPNKIVAGKQLPKLHITHDTMVEIMHKTLQDWPKLGTPTEMRQFLRNEKKIEVSSDEKPGFGPQITLRTNPNTNREITHNWDGLLVDIVAWSVISDLARYFDQVDNKLYAGKFGQPYRDQLTELLKKIQ